MYYKKEEKQKVRKRERNKKTYEMLKSMIEWKKVLQNGQQFA